MVSQQKCGANDIDLKNPAILSTDCTNRHTNWMKLYQLHQKSHHSHWFPSVWDGRVHLLLNLWPTSGKTKPTSLTCSSVESMQQKKKRNRWKWKLAKMQCPKRPSRQKSEKHESISRYFKVVVYPLFKPSKNHSTAGTGLPRFLRFLEGQAPHTAVKKVAKTWRNWNSTGACLSGGTNNRSALAGRYSHSSLSVCHTLLKTRQSIMVIFHLFHSPVNRRLKFFGMLPIHKIPHSNERLKA